MLLIVDDDIAVQTSLVLLLQQEGYAVKTAVSPTEALVLARQHTAIQLVILDLNYSVETSGIEGMEALKKFKTEFPMLPIIVLTGWGTIDLAVQGMRLGANDFLTKPWQNEQLLQSVRTLLKLQQPARALPDRKALDQQYQLEQIIGEDAQLLDLLNTVGRVAPTDAAVLITGESGTGKN